MYDSKTEYHGIPAATGLFRNIQSYKTKTIKAFFSEEDIQFDDPETVDLILQIVVAFNSSQKPEADVFHDYNQMAAMLQTAAQACKLLIIGMLYHYRKTSNFETN